MAPAGIDAASVTSSLCGHSRILEKPEKCASSSSGVSWAGRMAYKHLQLVGGSRGRLCSLCIDSLLLIVYVLAIFMLP